MRATEESMVTSLVINDPNFVYLPHVNRLPPVPRARFLLRFNPGVKRSGTPGTKEKNNPARGCGRQRNRWLRLWSLTILISSTYLMLTGCRPFHGLGFFSASILG